MFPEQSPRCNPTLFGPLTYEPEMVTGPSQFFPGEDKYFSEKKLNERVKMWEAVAPHLDRVLNDDETVLHIMPVLHVPSILHLIGFGIWWSFFFRTTLVLTDRRIVEIFTPDWKKAGTKVVSYSWGQVQKLKQSLGTLSVKPAKGRKQQWKLPVRGDRKLMKLLVPNIQDQLAEDIHVERTVPMWHCPECGAATEKHPKVCRQCATTFKSQSRAAALALAFPGAGLFYAGHPVLGALDLIGESLLFILVAVTFLTAATPVDLAGAVVLGIFLLAFTKLESIHLSTILVHRTISDPDRGRWRKIMIGGAILSLVLMALPPIFSGTLGNQLDADLDLTANSIGWSGSHDPGQWLFDGSDDQRSEWVREDGQALFVFSVPRGEAETIDLMETTVLEEGQQAKRMILGGFECLRAIEEFEDEDGEPALFLRWFVFDRVHDDIHILSTWVAPGGVEALESEVGELLQAATWKPLTGD